jgi:hypothetical protein
MNFRVLTSVVATLLVTFGQAIAAPPYVCSTKYVPNQGQFDTTGPNGHISFTTSSGSHCTGTISSTQTLCSGTSGTDPACTRTYLNEPSLLEVNSALAAAATSGTRVGLYYDLCNSSQQFNCLHDIEFRGN